MLDLAALERVAAEVEAALGPLDVLVCAAGGNQPAASTSQAAPFFDLDPQAIDAVLAVNFTGTFRCCHVFGRRMAERGQAIVAHTPMGRLGAPEDLLGALLWLASPASAFVTGIVMPVDGGYSAFGGV